MIQEYTSKNIGSTWIGHLFEVQTKNNFGFILVTKFGFLFAKLNLSFGLRVVLKYSTKD